MNKLPLDKMIFSQLQNLTDAEKEKVINYIENLKTSFYDGKKLERIETFKNHFSSSIAEDRSFWYLAVFTRFMRAADIVPLLENYLRASGIDSDLIKKYKDCMDKLF